MNSKEMAKLVCSALEDKKAEDIKVINIAEVSVLADYFIIASGTNRSQVQAMSDNVEEVLGRAGVSPRQIEGYQTANWVLLDYGDVIVHVFDQENRLFYDLDVEWRRNHANIRKALKRISGGGRAVANGTRRKARSFTRQYFVL